jgi:hypothetical protein
VSGGKAPSRYHSRSLAKILLVEHRVPLLLDPGTWDCPRGTLLPGYGMGHGPRPTSIVITRNAVGLLVE